MITKPTHQTHMAAARMRNSDLMLSVCELLHRTPEQYCGFQFTQYERFALLVTQQDRYFRERLRYSTVYRGFWNNEWMQREEIDFLPYAYETKFDLSEIMEEYIYIHSVERLYHDEAFYTRFEGILKLIK